MFFHIFAKIRIDMKLEFTGTPLDYARGVPAKDLKRLIRDCKKGEYDEFTDRCRICFEKYLTGDLNAAQWWSNHAEAAR